ncbi:MAG: hypothetical protein ACI8ZM_000773 [Crocinitomix sp.]|jgi:hypothetical protein
MNVTELKLRLIQHAEHKLIEGWSITELEENFFYRISFDIEEQDKSIQVNYSIQFKGTDIRSSHANDNWTF